VLYFEARPLMILDCVAGVSTSSHIFLIQARARRGG